MIQQMDFEKGDPHHHLTTRPMNVLRCLFPFKISRLALDSCKSGGIFRHPRAMLYSQWAALDLVNFALSFW